MNNLYAIIPSNFIDLFVGSRSGIGQEPTHDMDAHLLDYYFLYT